MIAGALVSDTNRSIATAMRLRPVKGHCIERYGVRMANEKLNGSLTLPVFSCSNAWVRLSVSLLEKR
jgi:hypothetical protein